MYNYENFTIAVDFDDTCVLSKDAGYYFPEYGADIPHAVETLRNLSQQARIILLTCREGASLYEAKKWFEKHDIPLFGINSNPDPYWIDNQTRKIYADLVIDDKNVGIPRKMITVGSSQYYALDWVKIESIALEAIENWKKGKEVA